MENEETEGEKAQEGNGKMREMREMKERKKCESEVKRKKKTTLTAETMKGLQKSKAVPYTQCRRQEGEEV